MTETMHWPIDPATERAAKLFVESAASRYAIRQAWLYGSRARGTARSDSDADVALLIDGPPGDFLQARLALDDLAYDVLLETGICIQPLPLWMAQWEDPRRFVNPALIRAVQREGLPL